MKILYTTVIALLAVLLADNVQAELEPLLFSGEPGIMFDTDNDGNIDAMITAMYDADTDIIVAQAGQGLGGGTVIYQITLSFGTQVIQEIAQFPPEGEAQFVNSRSPEDFTEFFLDTVDFTPLNQAAVQLLQQLLGGAK